MNKVTFLRLLRISLRGLPETEIADIVRDYEEHFNIGISKGKMEEEISAELGNPVELAKGYFDADREEAREIPREDEDRAGLRSVYREDSEGWEYRESSRSSLNIAALIGLILLTCMVMIPLFGGLFGVLAGLFAAAVAFAGASVISLLAALGIFGIPGTFIIPFTAGLSMFLAGASGCCFYGLIFAGKWFVKGVVAYFRWCWRVSGGVSDEK